MGFTGLMLTFMFLWNMLGALTLLPAHASYLVKAAREPTEPVPIEAGA